MTTRRTFISYTAGTTLALFAYAGGVKRALAEIPGGTLPPSAVPKFRTPLLIPPVMPKADRIVMRGGKNADYYEISMRQFAQQILPAGFPSTTVWGYGAVSSANPNGLLLHHAPSLTIEAKWNAPVVVKWINDLKDANGDFLPHLLPVDQTLHWANPPGGALGRDEHPEFGATPGPYAGPVPIVTHVHGMAPVGDDSDGYSEAWYLPAARNIPAGFARVGTWYDFFHGKSALNYGVSWGPGFARFAYPNAQPATTLWYHDHALGMTRTNVYAGPAGFYIIRGGPAGDGALIDRRYGTPAVLPGPAPKEHDPYPSKKPYREIPIVIQDRSFNDDGSLFYPDSRAFFDGYGGPYVPHSDLPPNWNPEFFGNMTMVNGATWPFLEVEQRRYRFRFLNGCQSRFLILDFNGVPGVKVWQIGGDGGFLSAPANLTARNGNRLLLGPAERADVIVDFTHTPQGRHVLSNVGPDEPFGGGVPGVDFEPADPAGTGKVLQFRVRSALEADATTPPQYLKLPAIAQPGAAANIRRVALLEAESAFFDGPAQARLGVVEGDPAAGAVTPSKRQWEDAVTENPSVGVQEIWEIYNATEDAHPIHLHDVGFKVLNRQPILVDEETSAVHSVGPVNAPEIWETGLKDTVIAYPGEVTRIAARWTNRGQFVWHCHILEHEDNEMMRPLRVGPKQPGEPGEDMA